MVHPVLGVIFFGLPYLQTSAEIFTSPESPVDVMELCGVGFPFQPQQNVSELFANLSHLGL